MDDRIGSVCDLSATTSFELVSSVGERPFRDNQFGNRFWVSCAAVTHAIGAYSPRLSRYGFPIETAGGNQDKVVTDRQFTADVA